jgi:membrane-associated protease RseP (regulator of RpoE activity)
VNGVVIFIIAILVVVMIHEAGHFFVAKAFNFKATQFFVGFGPTLWSVKKGETEYGVKALPLGGFVKIVGMNPYEEIPPEDEHRSYANKPRWQRALVIVAGSATHFVVAFVILLIAAMTIGFPTGDVSNKVAAVEPSVEGAPSAAEAAGLQPGDEIIGVGGLETTDWEEIREFIREHAGEQVAFSVRRDGEVVELEAELGSALFDADDQLVEYAPFGEQLRPPGAGEELVGFLGVQPDIEFQKEGLIGAAGDSAGRTWEVTKLSFRGIGETATMVFGGELWDALRGEGQRELDEGPLGIVGAGRFASESVESGRLLDLVGLIVGFTVFVGLMNLLPLPPLDGGYLAVLAYESITRKTVDVRKLIPVAAAVISFFVILFVAVLYLDLARPIKVPF